MASLTCLGVADPDAGRGAAVHGHANTHAQECATHTHAHPTATDRYSTTTAATNAAATNAAAANAATADGTPTTVTDGTFTTAVADGTKLMQTRTGKYACTDRPAQLPFCPFSV